MSRPRFLAIVLLITASSAPSPLRAESVIVPDAFATLQAAFDIGADTIRVRPGRYRERPRFNGSPVNASVVMIADDPSAPRPRFDGLSIHNDDTIYLTVRGIAFEGAVDLFTPSRPRKNQIRFEHCTLDSGLYHRQAGDVFDIDSLVVRNSRIRGAVAVTAYIPVCESDTIEAGGVQFGGEGQPIIRDCRITGPGTFGIFVAVGPEFRGEIARNEIVGPYDAGIQVHDALGGTIQGNRVSSCTQGIVVFGSESTVSGNDVRDCGTGIHWYAGGDVILTDNRVFGSTQDGIRIEGYENFLVERNIVGRSGGHGIHLDMDYKFALYPNATLRSNTSYGNGGSGFAVTALPILYGPFALTVRQNIGFGNGEYGYDAGLFVPSDLQCNDWFANGSGAVQGGAPPEDFQVDPWLCDPVIDSVGLQHGSPLLAKTGCGLIGARGEACATTPTLVQLFQAEYDGAVIEVRWMLSEEPAAIVVERADAGSEVWRPIPVSPTRIGDTTVARDSDVAPGRAYRYRLAWRLASGEWERSFPVEVVARTAPVSFALGPVTPNPAAGILRLQWSMPRAANVDLRVYDLAGREMAILARGWFDAGVHVVAWNVGGAANPMAAGIYFVRLRSGEHRASRSFLVRR